MKAQLRTYHAIPSLQAHTDSNAYKQLQDAPRLKSILKGACEDRKEPQTLDQINSLPHPPRTNPINLVFILSTYAPKITEVHFPHNLDFYDLIMRSTLSSKSRARAFLWLMWYYLESDFSQESTQANPYGPGLPCHKDKTDLRRVPDFEPLTEEQAAKENVDTAVEVEFGELKREERKRMCPPMHNVVIIPAPSGMASAWRFTDYPMQVFSVICRMLPPDLDEDVVEKAVSFTFQSLCFTTLEVASLWTCLQLFVVSTNYHPIIANTPIAALAASPDVQSPSGSPPPLASMPLLITSPPHPPVPNIISRRPWPSISLLL